MNWPRLLPVLLALPLLLTGCASTRLIDEWRQPGATDTFYRNLLVIGVSEEEAGRRGFEDRLSDALSGHGVRATPGYRLIRSTAAASQPELLDAVRDSGADAVLITRILRLEDRTEYTPGFMSLGPPPGLYGYYFSAWTYYQPPRIHHYRVTVLETNLWDAGSDELVWSGTVESYRSGLGGTDPAELSAIIVRSLARQGLIAAPAKSGSE